MESVHLSAPIITPMQLPVPQKTPHQHCECLLIHLLLRRTKFLAKRQDRPFNTLNRTKQGAHTFDVCKQGAAAFKMSSPNNGSGGNRLFRVQKIAQQSSWRNSCKRKRQLAKAASSSQTSTPNKNDSPLQLDQLPLNTLVIVASQLPFDDFKHIGFVSKKLNSAQRITRYSRKRISVDLLRRLFPEEPFHHPQTGTDNDEEGGSGNIHCEDDEDRRDGMNRNNTVGMLQVMRPFRKTLRCSPSRNFDECDLSEFGAFKESHFSELLRSVNNGRELFAEVRRLNVQGCVIEIKDMAFLAQLMPKVWFIRCSAHTLVIPESTEQKALSNEQLQQLRRRVENFAHVSQQFTRKHLWFLAQLTELFPGLEMVQLDN